MAVFAGQGDIRRSMALLWRQAGDGQPVNGSSGPGRKPRLSVDLIVGAAIAIADSDDLSAVSMRTVGDRLGRTGMAIYTYVPSKSELVDLMYDRCLAELPAEYDLEAGWRAALANWADDLCAFYVRHPWLLQVSTARPVLGPNEYLSMNTVIGILYRTGLDAALLRRIVGLMFHCVRGSAQTITEARQAASATGISDEQWWADRSLALNEFAPDFAERFPMVLRLETDSARAAVPPVPAAESTAEADEVPHLEREARQTFRVGLEVLLDGIEETVRRTCVTGS